MPLNPIPFLYFVSFVAVAMLLKLKIPSVLSDLSRVTPTCTWCGSVKITNTEECL